MAGGKYILFLISMILLASIGVVLGASEVSATHDNNAGLQSNFLANIFNGIKTFIFSGTLTGAATAEYPTSCSDSDGGNQYYTKGTCTETFPNGSTKIYVDACSGTYTKDYYCGYGGPSKPYTGCIYSTLGDGSTCSDGVAVYQSQTVTCTDTDSGKLDVAGTCTDSTGASFTDECTPGPAYPGYITEYRCLSTGGCYVDVNQPCPTGSTCQNGACIGGAATTIIYYEDADADTYGSPNSTTSSTSTTAPSGYVANSKDCNDNNAAINPSSAEVCGNNIDEDCNGADLACPVIPTCTPSWTCTSWSTCTNSQQTRTCTDSNVCGTTDSKPVELQSCTSVTSATTSTKCSDSDGAGNWNVKGTCTDKYSTKTDACTSTAVVDYYCYTGIDPDGTCQQNNYQFSTTRGESCSDGILVAQCKDTDSGTNYYTLGTCTDPTGSYTDSCASSTSVQDYFCSSGKCSPQKSTISGYSCTNGVLVASVCTPTAELCNNKDDNCNGLVDDGLNKGQACTTGVGACQKTGVYQCATDGGVICSATASNPTTEICGNGIDEDCNGADLACTTYTYYKDTDGDTYGSPTSTTSSTSTTAPSGYVSNNLDCNDANAIINPNSAEVCDDLDNNCDGSADEGLQTKKYYLDLDGDGYGDISTAFEACGVAFIATGAAVAPAGYTEIGGDCQDNNINVYPGAVDVCGNGVDEDCSGADLACPIAVAAACTETDNGKDFLKQGTCTDDSGKTYSDYCLTATGSVVEFYCTSSGGVCNTETYGDASGSCSNGAWMPCTPTQEICGNNIDEDCNGADLQCPAFCTPTTEICGDGIDQDCDGGDLACPIQCIDSDGADNFNAKGECKDNSAAYTDSCSGDGKTAFDYLCSSENICTQSSKAVPSDGSCTDGIITITVAPVTNITAACTLANSGVEICGDGIDQDCSGADLACPIINIIATTAPCVDDDKTNFNVKGTCTDTYGKSYLDYCADTSNVIQYYCTSSGLCSATNPQSVSGYACSDGALVPACTPTTELCNNKDDNCNNLIDEYFNKDETCIIGVGACARSGTYVCSADGSETLCNAVSGSPTTEICGNGIDEDCNGADLVCVVATKYYRDADGDSYGDPYTSKSTTTQPSGYVANSKDCNDNNAAINPSSAEVCGNNIDEDCNGADLQCPAFCTPTTEICGDGIDQDCNGYDMACQVQCADSDGPSNWRSGYCTDGTGIHNDYCRQTDNAVIDYTCIINDIYAPCFATARTLKSGETCINGGLALACTPANGGVEICGNGIDEDCTGADLACTTITTCTPTAETCDNKDNDCDNLVDEDFTAKGQACTSGQGVCQKTGTYVCISDGSNTECNAIPGPSSTEICGNWIDEDCDGSDLVCPTAPPEVVSAPSCTPTTEICGNGIDEDCDGSDLACPIPAVVETISTPICTPTTEICGDGIDQDCDGSDLACPTVCMPDWGCTTWSKCAKSKQTRTCTDANNCGTTDGKPTETQSCKTGGKKISGAASATVETNVLELMLKLLRWY